MASNSPGKPLRSKWPSAANSNTTSTGEMPKASAVPCAVPCRVDAADQRRWDWEPCEFWTAHPDTLQPVPSISRAKAPPRDGPCGRPKAPSTPRRDGPSRSPAPAEIRGFQSPASAGPDRDDGRSASTKHRRKAGWTPRFGPGRNARRAPLAGIHRPAARTDGRAHTAECRAVPARGFGPINTPRAWVFEFHREHRKIVLLAEAFQQPKMAAAHRIGGSNAIIEDRNAHGFCCSLPADRASGLKPALRRKPVSIHTNARLNALDEIARFSHWRRHRRGITAAQPNRKGSISFCPAPYKSSAIIARTAVTYLGNNRDLGSPSSRCAISSSREICRLSFTCRVPAKAISPSRSFTPSTTWVISRAPLRAAAASTPTHPPMFKP